MLEVQKYLQVKTFTDLENELGIKSTKHDVLPLAILNYDQIDSPKTHPVVKECRGLVLNTSDFSVVARSFSRFFNWGEVVEDMNAFDFGDFVSHTKEDGSLVLIFNFDGRWMANTRGSFGQLPIDFQDFTWEQAFCKSMGLNDLQELSDKLNPEICYVCEFCSPYNKIVRRYTNPQMYLLTAFHGIDELHWKEVDKIKCDIFTRPERHEFKNVKQIQDFLSDKAEKDQTFEGVVICDKNRLRYKVKNPTYIALHQLRGNGDSLFNPKHLIPFVLSGEQAELLTYFEEATESFLEVKKKIDEAYYQLEEVWDASRGIVEQKEFALKIIGKTPFTGILFQLRKEHGANIPLQQLKNTWRNSADAILKVIFK